MYSTKRYPLPKIRRLAVLFLVGVTVSTLAACGSSSKASGGSTSGGTASGNALSQTKVSILSTATQDTGLYWIAQQKGFFQQQGLDVDLVTASTGGGSQALADFLSGKFDFINTGIFTGLVAAKSGAQLTAVATTDISQPLQIAINDAPAQKYHIPTAGDTPQEALAQLQALKGTHITVGTTLGSSTYYSFLAVCKANGLTCQLNSKTADVDLVTAGTVSALVTGLKAEKFDAIVNIVPQSTQPNTVPIKIGIIPPLSTAADFDLVTKPAFVKAHPDTVQAFVTAYVQAWDYAKKNPADAEKYVADLLKQDNITDPAEAQELYNDYAQFWLTPLVLKDAYNNALQLASLAGQSANVPYEQYNDPSFAEKAVQQLGLTVPTSVSSS